MVSQIRGCMNYRFLCQKYSVCNASNTKTAEDRKKETKRYKSAPLVKENANGQRKLDAKSLMAGPRCSSLPLQKRDRLQNRTSKVTKKSKSTHEKILRSRTSPLPISIYPSLCTPHPPATTPVDSCSESSFDMETSREFCSKQGGYDDVDLIQFDNSRDFHSRIDKQAAVVQRIDNGHVKLQQSQQKKLNIGSQRPKTTATAIVQRVSIVQMQHGTNDKHDNNDVKQNIESQLKSNAEPTLKVQKYSCADLATRKNQKKLNDDVKAVKHGPSNIFLLTHKGIKKCMLLEKGKITNVKTTEISDGLDKRPKNHSFNQKFPAKINAAINSTNCASQKTVRQEKSSLKLKFSGDKSDLTTPAQGTDQVLLPQFKLKHPVKLKISDILSTVDLFRPNKNTSTSETKIFSKKQDTSSSSSRKEMNIPKTIQDVWSKIEDSNKPCTKKKPKECKNIVLQKTRCKGYDEIFNMDDRLGKSDEDSRFIMRKRYRKTSEILQLSAKSVTCK